MAKGFDAFTVVDRGIVHICQGLIQDILRTLEVLGRYVVLPACTARSKFFNDSTHFNSRDGLFEMPRLSTDRVHREMGLVFKMCSNALGAAFGTMHNRMPVVIKDH